MRTSLTTVRSCLSAIADGAWKTTQNTISIASAFAIISGVMASAYVIGFEGWTIAASLVSGCGAACVPGAVYVAIDKGWDLRRKLGLAASAAPALIIAALYFAGIAPEPQGRPQAGERRSPLSVSARAESATPARSYALPKLFAAYRLSHDHKLIRNRQRQRRR